MYCPVCREGLADLCEGLAQDPNVPLFILPWTCPKVGCGHGIPSVVTTIGLFCHNDDKFRG